MIVFSPLIFLLISVVLLDTTSVLGELGWKTYPINGVRTSTYAYDYCIWSYCPVYRILFKMHGHCCINKINYIDGNRSERVAGNCFIFTFCFCSDPSVHMGNNVTWRQTMSQDLWGGFPKGVQSSIVNSCPVYVTIQPHKYFTNSLNSQRKAKSDNQSRLSSQSLCNCYI